MILRGIWVVVGGGQILILQIGCSVVGSFVGWGAVACPALWGS
jgi:hypothetical protein